MKGGWLNSGQHGKDKKASVHIADVRHLKSSLTLRAPSAPTASGVALNVVAFLSFCKPLFKSFAIMSTSALEAVLRHDRAIIIAALSALTVLAWADLVWLADDMAMGGMDMSGFRMIPAGQGLMMSASEPWKPIEFGYVFAMWVVMMIGMMTPSVAPMILIYARVGRQAAAGGKPFAATGWFGGGYLLAWTAFSLAATSAQWALERTALLNPMMESTSNVLGGIVLIAAGLYQWTPVKDACLSYCQAPLTFIMRHGGFRGNPAGALTLGLRHGIYCIGCCWGLMALLFVGGIMNLFWIAVLAILVLLEKVIPFGRIIARLAGLAFMAGGGWMLVHHA